MKKIIVAHPGRQHSFMTAGELKKEGLLFKYITTVYNSESSLLMRLIRKCVSGDDLKRAEGRRTEMLQDTDVLRFCEIAGLIEVFLARYDKKDRLYTLWHNLTSDRFGKKVAKYAIKNKADAVILYDTNALTAFSVLREKAPGIARIMDVSAANRAYMKTVYEQDFLKNPAFADKLRTETRHVWNKRLLSRLEKEISLTQYFLAPSLFVKESLNYSGVKDEQIAICPYGTNFPVCRQTRKLKPEGPLEAVYVGNVTELKGIFYLLEAAKAIPKTRVHLSVVGAYDNSSGLLTPYMEHVSFIGRVTHEKVYEILQASDFFVFASLGEGFGLSILEALACGLPCIVTRNSGATDAISEGNSGFVVDVQDSDALREKMLWFDGHRDRIPEMSRNALRTAEQYSWENHERCIAEALRKWDPAQTEEIAH